MEGIKRERLRVVCVVADLAWESCVLWMRMCEGCDWGIAAPKKKKKRRGAPHIAHTEVISSRALISTCKKTSGEHQRVPPLEYGFCRRVHVVPPPSGPIQRERGREGKVLALMNSECAEDDLLEHLKDL